ncbi:MAG TPA: STAS domain-containing protein [Thermoleophilia bacterium]|nr:STAS domain-containing protein [Thermoleophilia bacterium]
MTSRRDEWSGSQGARLLLRRMGAKPGLPVVFLEGEFDIETVPEIDRFLRRSFGPLFYKRHIVLDLEAVTAVDSIFVGFVVGLVRLLHAEHKELVLTRPVGHVRRVLSLIGLPNLVPVYDSLEEAVVVVANDSLPAIPPAFSPVALV